MTSIAVPAVTAAAGIAGGVFLGRNRAGNKAPAKVQRNRKILGVRVPGITVDLVAVTRQIGEASRQFGRLAHEVQVTREKAEQIGKAIS